jgi:hypothetical protein
MIPTEKIQPWAYVTDGKRLLEIVEIPCDGVVRVVDCSKPVEDQGVRMGINAVARLEAVRYAPEIPDAA